MARSRLVLQAVALALLASSAHGERARWARGMCCPECAAQTRLLATSLVLITHPPATHAHTGQLGGLLGGGGGGGGGFSGGFSRMRGTGSFTPSSTSGSGFGGSGSGFGSGSGGGGFLSRLENRLESRRGGGGGGGGSGGNGGGSGPAIPLSPAPSGASNIEPNKANSQQSQFATATDTRGTNLGGNFGQQPVAAGAGGAGLRNAFMSAAAAAPQSAAASLGAPAPAAAPVTLRLANACAGAQLQALVHIPDASGAADSGATLGFFDVKPGDTVTVGVAPARAAYVYAQEKGKGCAGGGRCWTGTAGRWSVNDDPKQPAFGFVALDIPQNADPSYTYAFKC